MFRSPTGEEGWGQGRRASPLSWGPADPTCRGAQTRGRAPSEAQPGPGPGSEEVHSFFFLFFTVMDALLGRMNQLILISGSDYFGAASSHFSIFFFTSLDLN